MGKSLVIIGIGETAKIAYEYFTHDSDFNVVAFSAEQKYITAKVINKLPIIPYENLSDFYPPNPDISIFVAISSTKLNTLRTRFYSELKEHGYKFASYISSKAFVWNNVEIGENTFIFENNTIQPFVKIGNNCILWSGNHIGHNSIIHDNVFLSSQCVVSGFCEIKENCFIGVNATIANNLIIESDCFIGAGSLILKNTQARKVYHSTNSPCSNVDSFRFCKVDK